jgi:hypothetical protein
MGKELSRSKTLGAKTMSAALHALNPSSPLKVTKMGKNNNILT